MSQGIVLTRSGSASTNVSNATGTLSINNGGTGLTSIGGPNQILGVNAAGTALEYKTLVAGSNVTITNAAGQITIAATAGAGGVSQIIAGTNVTISPPGGTGVVTINATGGGSSLQLYAENPVSPSPPSATGTNSIALLSASQATAANALAIGVQAVSRTQYGVVQAGGRFASSGDAQVGRYTLRIGTSNAIPTTMFVDGVSVPLVMPDNSTWTFRATITGHRTDAGDGHAGYEITGVIYRQSGAATTTILGKISQVVVAESNTPWNATAAADTVNGGLMLQVSGETSKSIRWLALVETVEITN